MRILSVSEDDMALLKAVKPFLSDKSQGMLDVIVTVLNVFKPMQQGQGVDVDALATLMEMVQTSSEKKKMSKDNIGKEIEIIAEFEDKSEQHNDVKNLEHFLTLLAEKENKSEK